MGHADVDHFVAECLVKEIRRLKAEVDVSWLALMQHLDNDAIEIIGDINCPDDLKRKKMKKTQTKKKR